MLYPAEQVRPKEPVTLIKVADERRFRWSSHALLLSLLLLPVNIYWIGVTEGLWHALHLTTLSLPMNVLVIFIALAFVNHWLFKWVPQYALRFDELMLVFISLTVQSVYIGHDMMISLFGIIPAAAWFENPSNKWKELFFPYLPQWLVITDKEAVTPFYLGGRSFYGSELVSYWIRPAFFWTFLMTALHFSYAGLVGLFIHRWSREERLQFPVLRIPLLIGQGGHIWRNRRFWAGFAIAGLVEMINHLNFLYPFIPSFKTRARDRDLLSYLTDPPWNAIGSTPLALYPFIIGYAYLMPLDLCISTWLFYLLRKVERLLGVVLGLTSMARFPYENEQSAGAVLALATLSLYLCRSYIRTTIKGSDPSRYPMPRRFLSAAFLSGAGVCYILSALIGLGGGVSSLFWLIHFLTAFTVGRLRAEAGPPSHSLLFANPQDLLIATRGSCSFHPRQLTALALYFWFNRLNRNHPFPVIAEGWKAAEGCGLSPNLVGVTMLLMAFLSVVGCFLIYPVLFYKVGAATRVGEVVWVGQDTCTRLASWMSGLTAPDIWSPVMVVAGAAVTWTLAWGYQRTSSWILHPVGYLLGTSFAVDYYWLCLVIGSVVKGLIFRYWGGRAVFQAEPFFIGLVIGDGLVSSLWSVHGLIVHKPMYDAWW